MRKILTCIIVLTIFLANVKVYAASLPSVAAEGAILLDTNSGEILYSKNVHKTFYPASTTKIMTALLVLERGKLEDKVVIGKSAVGVDGSQIYVFEGEEFTVEQLLNSLMIQSANDAAIALAEYISGSVEGFAELMNERAAQLGCRNTHFVTPNGLHDDSHYTTAYDLSLIAREAMKNEIFRQIVNTKTYTIPPTNKQPKQREIYLNNYLVLNTRYRIEGANGVKTGFTDEAHHTFVGSAVRGDTSLMVVLLSEPSKLDMYTDATSLLNYGFEEYTTVKQVSAGDIISYYNVPGTDTQIPLIAQRSYYYTYQKDRTPDIKTNIVMSDSAKNTSITKGQVVGYLEYKDGTLPVGGVDLLSDGSYILPAAKIENSFKGVINKYHLQWVFMSAFVLSLAVGSGALLKRKQISG